MSLTANKGKEGETRQRETIFMYQGSTKHRRNMNQVDFIIVKTNYFEAIIS